LEDFKETGDETFAWESFEKELSAYSFLKYLVQENDIHVDLPGHILILILLNGHKISCPQQLDTEALSQSETFCEEY
jgi:hypothetical protein